MGTTDNTAQEKLLNAANGISALLLNTLLMLFSIALIVWGFSKGDDIRPPHVILIILGFLYSCLIGPVICFGFKVIKPGEALVLTLFGKYIGALKTPGFYYVHPFCSAVNPAADSKPTTAETPTPRTAQASGNHTYVQAFSKKLSLKSMTLNNDRQKINDKLGNPIIIGIVVVWRVVDTAKAVFNVDNYVEYLSIQCDSALRNIVRQYPYDATDDVGGESLRNSSAEIADRLRGEIQENVEIAGLEIMEARITHLAYAPEIAAAMLQRQQAS
ncbi:MAG: SPFH domain-containing protein, partial [Oscillospiraceae bacterium]|nr:SPFH domain-containing protein [Oscillospiraceae bacterium]